MSGEYPVLSETACSVNVRFEIAETAYLDRPEFGPRVTVATGETVWLPCHDAFRSAQGVEAEGPAKPGTGDATGAGFNPCCFETTADGWGLPPLTGDERDRIGALELGGGVVVAGQQPGFLGGPLFVVFKAATAIALAGWLEERTGRAVVPVFWVAGEDHDVDEVRSLHLPEKDGSTKTFSLPFETDRRPLSAHGISRDARAVAEAVAENLRGRRHDGDALRLVESYSSGSNLAAAFAVWLRELFSPWGLQVVDPEVLRPLTRPVLRRVLEEPEALEAAVAAGRNEVQRLGFRPQVSARFPLFLIENAKSGGRRHHLTPAAGGFRVDGGHGTLSTAGALEILDSRPERFSTGALLRPVVQQFALPVSAVVGGAAELAYFAQLGPVFELFGVARPPFVLRFHGTLIEGKVARALERLGIRPDSPGALQTAREASDLLPLESGEDPEAAFQNLASGVAQETRDILARVERDFSTPPAALRKIEKSARKAVEELIRLGKRARKVAAEARTDLRSAPETAWSHLFPDGVLQERRWSALHFVAKYGRGWVEDLIDECRRNPFEIRHRWGFFE